MKKLFHSIKNWFTVKDNPTLWSMAVMGLGLLIMLVVGFLFELLSGYIGEQTTSALFLVAFAGFFSAIGYNLKKSWKK